MFHDIRIHLLLLVSANVIISNPINNSPHTDRPDICNLTVIGHKGASGYVPEHTLGSYALAITLGADFIEPDLVMTKDGHLIARHSVELSDSTDVSQISAFAHLKKTLKFDKFEITGWFSGDFTLAEIKSLRVIESMPNIRPGNARLNGAFSIPTFQEIIDLVKSMQITQRRTVGICPEIKLSTYFKHLGLPMEQLVVNTLHNNGYVGRQAPVYIQSFEVSNLMELKNITDLPLLQLYKKNKLEKPLDQIIFGTGLNYEDMSTPSGLRKVAEYATAVGPEKSYIIPRNDEGRLSEPTNFVADAHSAGLKVFPHTFRAENNFLPADYRSDDSLTAIGDLRSEVKAFIDAGIDGLFCDQPDVPVNVRGCMGKD